jgi:soluble lytic murein transglycosylase
LHRLIIIFILLGPLFGPLNLSAEPREKIRDFIEQKKFPEAYEELKELEKKENFQIEANPEMFWLKGFLEFQVGKIEEARQNFILIINKDMWRADANYYLGLIEHKLTNSTKALEYYVAAEKASSNYKTRLDISFEKLKTLVFAKKWSESVKNLRIAEKRFRADARYAEILKMAARVNLEQNNYHGACKMIQKLYTKFPNDEIFKNNLPFIEKVEVYGASLNCSVDDDLFASHRKALFGHGQVDMVNREIEIWIEKFHLTGYEKDLLLAQKAMNEANFVHALDILLQHHDAKKNHVPYLNLLASVAMRSGNFALSIGANYRIFQLVGSASQKRKALYQAAIFSFQIQDYDGAQAKFSKYVQNFGRSKNAIDAKWYIAWIQYLKGHYRESGDLMMSMWREGRRQSKMRSYQEKIQYWLAMSLMKSGEVKRSIALFASLIKNSSELSFYSMVAQQRLKKIEELNIDPLVPIASIEPPSMLSMSFKMVFLNAQSFPDSYLNYQPTDDVQDLTVSSERNVASAEEEEIINGENEDGADAEKAESIENFGDSNWFDNLNSVQSQFLQSRIEKARFLINWGFEDIGKIEYNDIEHYLIKNDKNKSVLEDYQRLKDYFRLSTLGYGVWSRRGAPALDSSNRFIWESMYPLAYREDIKKWAEEFNLPQALIWGIMKAESQYRPAVVSPVGAQGLMQVMPFTGKKVSELLGENSFDSYRLKEPATAIKIGSKYLERMALNFQNSVPLIAAAYNAGPHRVQNWIYNFGYLEMDEWIEHIPYNETRLYVKKVTSNYLAYLNLYGESIKSKGISLIDTVPVKINEPMPLVEKWD